MTSEIEPSYDDECSLCREAAGDSGLLHVQMIESALPDRVLADSENFFVVPSIGALTPGHILIVPRRHVLNMLTLPTALLAECESLLNSCLARLQGIYDSDIVVFEHGSCPAREALPNACIEHAHLHLVPAPAKVREDSMQRLGNWASGRSLHELAARIPLQSSYLLVGADDRANEYWICIAPRILPSQFFRRLTAKRLGRETTWNWREFPGEEEFQQTIHDWKGKNGIPQDL